MSSSVRQFIVLWAAGAIGVTAGTAAQAQTSPEITRVEEDWVAYVRNPDSSTCAPQILNLISPNGTTSGPIGLIELNHGSQPEFDSGGFQVQTWVGDSEVMSIRSSEYRSLSRSYDKVSYTVELAMDANHFHVSLKNGRSRSWGWFAAEAVTASIPRYNHNLTDYNPQHSVDNTTINVGAHRVELLLQTETRYYSGNDLISTDPTDRVIHRFHELVQFVSLEEYELNSDEYNIDITKSN